MRLLLRSRLAAVGFVAAGEVVSRDLREGLDEGAVFADAVGEVDGAENFGSANGKADGVGCGDLLDAGRGDGDAEACAD
jgi:hypothetical protein